jgi:pimeloyl-ACP methyl ester carboxylesterase
MRGWGSALLAAALPLQVGLADPPAAPTGLQTNVVFTDSSPYSRDIELLRRSLSPLLFQRGSREAAKAGVQLRDQDIDLAHERFALYVPKAMPPQGYALLVFVSPFPEPIVPNRWQAPLDRHGMIFVSAANSGNGTSTLERREPLALLAAQNVINRYKVDPARVYVGGLSGGSRVAEHTALAYPDLFHGVLLNAGSDPLGEKHSVPPADLFRRFQESMRLVYLTGDKDETNLMTDAQSRRSMKDWCVFDIETVTIPDLGHQVVDPASLDRALDRLERHEAVDAKALADCRAAVDARMNAELAQVESLLGNGKSDEARAELDRIDARYGGLAAPRSLTLAAKLEAGIR